MNLLSYLLTYKVVEPHVYVSGGGSTIQGRGTAAVGLHICVRVTIRYNVFFGSRC